MMIVTVFLSQDASIEVYPVPGHEDQGSVVVHLGQHDLIFDLHLKRISADAADALAEALHQAVQLARECPQPAAVAGGATR